MIKGTIGANSRGSKPLAKATVLGIKAKKSDLLLPKYKKDKINKALMIGPVKNC